MFAWEVTSGNSAGAMNMGGEGEEVPGGSVSKNGNWGSVSRAS